MSKGITLDDQIDASYNVTKANKGENPFERKKQTNADRIRSMSDEELVEFIEGLNNHCLAGIGEVDCSNTTGTCSESCKKIVRVGLQSEVGE